MKYKLNTYCENSIYPFEKERGREDDVGGGEFEETKGQFRHQASCLCELSLDYFSKAYWVIVMFNGISNTLCLLAQAFTRGNGST